VIRNAGGVITDDVIRSLAISQKLLKTMEIVLTFKDDALKVQIEEDTGIRPQFAMEASSDLEDDVRQSVRRIQASLFVEQKGNIRAFVYSVEAGHLDEIAA